MVRTLVIGGLCVILIGCSCPVPPRETAATVPIDLKRVSFKPEPATTTVKPKKVGILTKPAAAKPPSEVRSVGRQTNYRNMDSKALPLNRRRHPVLSRKRQRPQWRKKQRVQHPVNPQRRPIL